MSNLIEIVFRRALIVFGENSPIILRLRGGLNHDLGDYWITMMKDVG
jgi:hypothetical protein